MVYVFLADGFEEMEALAPVDILRRAGVQVKTVGVTGETVEGAHGISVKADLSINDISLDDKLEMIVLPGGMPGTVNLENNDNVQKAVDYCVNTDKFIGAICAAPKILGNKGILMGREATCFPGFEDELKGAKLCHSTVVVDGKIVTAKGAGVALDFGLKLVEMLVSYEKAKSLKESLQCK